MADIEIVVKINEGIAQGIIDGENDTPRHIVRLFQSTIADAIKNGTPLPKGHGKLIDADELYKIYDERITYLYTLNKKDNPSRASKIGATNWCANTLNEAPTIIEAESEDKE